MSRRAERLDWTVVRAHVGRCGAAVRAIASVMIPRIVLARTMLARTMLACGLLAAGTVVVQAGPQDAVAARPRQQFVAPAAGTYALQVIQRAPGGRVLDIDGQVHGLQEYTTGKITLMSFMYTYCVDPVGCPLAFQTFSELRRRLLARKDLAPHVRLVSLSFDPTHDVPQAMKLYAGPLADAGSALRWHFLTTRSVQDLKPILDDLGQDVSVTLDANGKPTRVFNHLLKIFLIDAAGRVREIYTTAYLMPDVVFNDIDSLRMEAIRAARGADPRRVADRTAPTR